jgi:hypothetical protein
MTVNHESPESSGQFRLRLPKSLHADLVREARIQGVSLNSYVLYLLTTRHSEEMAWQEASAFYAGQLRDTVRQVQDRVMSLTLGDPESGGFSWRSTGSGSIVLQ